MKLFEADDWRDLDWDEHDPKIEKILEEGKKLGYSNESEDDLIYLKKVYKDNVIISISNEDHGKIIDNLVVAINIGNLSEDFLSPDEVGVVCALMQEALEVGEKDLAELTK